MRSAEADPRPWLTTLYEVYLVLLIVIAFGVVQRGTHVPNPLWMLFWPAISASGIVLLLLTPGALLRRARISLVVLALMVWITMSIAWTANIPEWRINLLRLVVAGSVLMVISSAYSAVHLVRAFTWTTWFAVILAFLLAIVTPGTTTVHLDPDGQFLFDGWRGSFDHKSGMMLFLCIGTATFLTHEHRDRERRIMLALIWALTLLSQSATGLAVLSAVYVVHWLSRRAEVARRSRAPFPLYVAAGAAVGLTALVLAAPTLVNLYGKDLTFTGRTGIWEVSIDTIGDSPWVGYGLGSVWIDQTSEPTASMIRQLGFAAGNSHQSVIEAGIQLGLIGAALLVATFWTCFRQVRRCRDTDPALARWGLLCLVVVSLFSMSESVAFGGAWFVLVLLSVLTPTRGRRGTGGDPDPDADVDADTVPFDHRDATPVGLDRASALRSPTGRAALGAAVAPRREA